MKKAKIIKIERKRKTPQMSKWKDVCIRVVENGYQVFPRYPEEHKKTYVFTHFTDVVVFLSTAIKREGEECQ